MAYEIGKESNNSINGSAARTLARWEGAELSLQTWLKDTDCEIYLQDHWSLSDDSRTLTMKHHDDALAGQVAILERDQAETSRFEGQPVEIDANP